MNAIPLWLRYTLLRVLLFAAPLAVLLIAGVTPWIAVLVAALFGFSASLIFLRRQREQLAEDLYAARHREAPVARDDDEVEDAAVDAAAAPSVDAAVAPSVDAAAAPSVDAAAARSGEAAAAGPIEDAAVETPERRAGE